MKKLYTIILIGFISVFNTISQTTAAVEAAMQSVENPDSYPINELTQLEARAKIWKALDIKIDKNITESYLYEADKGKSSYWKNEIELQEEIVATKQDLVRYISMTNDYDVYYVDIEAYFDEYDFEKNLFPCNPFRKVNFGNGVYKYFQHVNTWELFFGIGRDINASVDVTVKDINFFEGFEMNPEEAKDFLNNRKINSGYYQGDIDRKVYIRLYYEFDTKNIDTNTFYDYNININANCKPLMLEVYNDKCYQELLGTYGYGLPYNYYKTTNKIEPPNLEETDNYKQICYWTKLNKKLCKYEYDIFHAKKKYLGGNTYDLYLKLHTNLDYYIVPGSKLIFINDNIQYPLAIYDTDIEDDYIIIKTKVSKETLSEIITNNCKTVHVYIDGYIYFDIQGGDGVKNKGEVQYNYQYFILKIDDTIFKQLLKP